MLDFYEGKKHRLDYLLLLPPSLIKIAFNFSVLGNFFLGNKSNCFCMLSYNIPQRINLRKLKLRIRKNSGKSTQCNYEMIDYTIFLLVKVKQIF
jgi:hypothetical protein